ncbi:MAG: hypothetical protein GX595_20130 [Lentisphaerae bacterium]|nr:hypothetical protein [Lentisphaerota bacterium]
MTSRRWWRLVGVFCVCGLILRSAEEPAPAAPFTLASPEFPIGMFSVDNPRAMEQVAAMGVSYIHTYGSARSASPEDLARDRAYLDAAQAHGLRVMFNLNGRRYVGQDGGMEAFRQVVTAVKDHPALGFWYLYDEPDGKHTVDDLRPFYAFLKETTPAIPVAIASAWSKGWYGFQDVLDILMIDIYPVQHLPFPQSKLNTMTTFTDGALRRGKPVMPINQCMNWKVLAGDATEYRGSPTAELRYPSAEELRYWCYSGLAQGVRGMFWWSYYRSVQGDPRWIRETFGPVVREFAEFTREIAPAHEAVRFERAADTNLIMALWRRDAASYLVLVNAWPTPQTVSRWMEDRIAAARLTEWGSTRKVGATLSGGQLKVGVMEPWEALAWCLDEVEIGPAPAK